jgi:hypothetical protein
MSHEVLLHLVPRVEVQEKQAVHRMDKLTLG